MYFWLVYIVWLCSMYLIGLFFSATLEKRWMDIPSWVLPLFLVLISAVPEYFRAVYSYDITSLQYKIFNWLETICSIVYVLIVFKDKFWKKVLLYVLLIFVICIGQMGTNGIVHIAGESYDMTFNSGTTVLYFIFYSVEVFFLLLPVIFLWRKYLGNGIRIKYIGFLIILPIAQLLMLLSRATNIEEYTKFVNMGIYIGFILSLLVDFILFYILLKQSEKEHLERQLKEKEQLRTLEALRYEELEARREELSKFRHDYNNQLTTALLLEEQGNGEVAKEMIEKLKELVNSAK